MQKRKPMCVFLSALLCAGLMMPLSVSAQTQYNDFDTITSHVNLDVPERLSISRPIDGEVTVNAANYFITGSSDPRQPLTVNGEAVETRGERGSFGVYVKLGTGVNEFVLKNGSDSTVVTIRQGSDSTVTTTDALSGMAPSYDCATMGGSTMKLSCVAPSGASVSATVNGQNVTLKQAAATAVQGVPATFQGELTAPSYEQTRNLGPVTYTMRYQGKTTSYQSEGQVFVAGKSLVVQVKNNAASVYNDEKHSAFVATAKLGAVDYVTDINSSDYKLSSGGWVPKESMQPLTGNIAVTNTVTNISGPHQDDTASGGEYYTIVGTSNPMFRAYEENGELYVKLFRTAGATGYKDITENSQLFSGVEITEENNATIFRFKLESGRTLWGYDISYDRGETTIYAKYRPAISTGSKPLAGITVAVDAGHGGSDPGAIGIPGTDGAVESEITLATAVALQKRLQSLGATVVMIREDESDISMNERMTTTRQFCADFFISLHCNSIGYASNAASASGTETYFFFENSRSLASSITRNVSSYTGRKNRGEKQSNYRVTLNSYSPSVLVEMGFLSNPSEYDDMTSKQAIFQTVNAIGDSIVASLK